MIKFIKNINKTHNFSTFGFHHLYEVDLLEIKQYFLVCGSYELTPQITEGTYIDFCDPYSIPVSVYECDAEGWILDKHAVYSLDVPENTTSALGYEEVWEKLVAYYIRQKEYFQANGLVDCIQLEKFMKERAKQFPEFRINFPFHEETIRAYEAGWEDAYRDALRLMDQCKTKK